MIWWEKYKKKELGSPLYKSLDGLATTLQIIIDFHPEVEETIEQLKKEWKIRD